MTSDNLNLKRQERLNTTSHISSHLIHTLYISKALCSLCPDINNILLMRQNQDFVKLLAYLSGAMLALLALSDGGALSAVALLQTPVS